MFDKMPDIWYSYCHNAEEGIMTTVNIRELTHNFSKYLKEVKI